MKKLFLLLILLIASTASAAPNVDDRLNELFSRINKEKDLTAILDYVHWSSAYKQIPAEYRILSAETTPELLKKKVEMLIANPRDAIIEELGVNVDKMPPAQKAILEKMMGDQIRQAEDALKKEMAEFASAEYKIVSTKVEGESAKAVVNVNGASGPKQVEMDLILVDGVWYLSGFGPNKGSL